MNRSVTEQDFRMPEFRNAKPEDYEFRDDGKLVRKDRWMTGMFQIAACLGFSSRKGFEIDDVVEKAGELGQDAGLSQDWTSDVEDLPGPDELCHLRLQDGSLLKGAVWLRGPQGTGRWAWGGSHFELAAEPPAAAQAVEAWRVVPESE